MKRQISTFAFTLLIGLSTPALAAFQLVAQDVFEKLDASAESDEGVIEACTSSKSSNACKTATSKALFSIYQSNTNALINTMNEESYTPEEYKRINDIQAVWIKELTGKTYAEVLVQQKDRLSLVIDMFNAFERKAEASEKQNTFARMEAANAALIGQASIWAQSDASTSKCADQGFRAAHQHSVNIIEAFRNRNINYLANLVHSDPKRGPGKTDLQGAKFEDFFTDEIRTKILSTEGTPNQCRPLGKRGTSIADGAMWLEYAPKDWEGDLSIYQIDYYVWPKKKLSSPLNQDAATLEPFPRDLGGQCFATAWYSSDNYKAVAEYFNEDFRTFSHPGEYLSREPELFLQFEYDDSFLSFLRLRPDCTNVPHTFRVIKREAFDKTSRGEPYVGFNETIESNGSKTTTFVRFIEEIESKAECDRLLDPRGKLACKSAAYINVDSEFSIFGLVAMADGREAVMPLRKFDGEAEMRRHLAGKR
ncbi:hypothetical protein OAL88_00565 [bacterium]|nr:hypothetical protein [bacterium]